MDAHEGKGKRSTGDDIQQCGSQETDPAIDHGTASGYFGRYAGYCYDFRRGRGGGVGCFVGG